MDQQRPPRVKKVVKTVKIKTFEDDPIPAEVLAESIRDVAQGFRKLRDGALKEETVVTLIASLTDCGKPAIREVLHACQHFDEKLLNKR